MVLRFEVNQAEAFRQGVNVPKSTNHIDVDPATLSQEDRNLIADRMDGIDVCQLEFITLRGEEELWKKGRIVAKLPTFDALMEAVRANENAIQDEVKKSKSEAVA